MKKTLADLALERGRLTERIGVQRAALAHQLVPFQRAAATSDKVSAFVARCVVYARQHPLLMAGGLGLLAVLKPRRSLRWVQRGVVLWRTWKAVQTWKPQAMLAMVDRLRRFI